MITHAYTEDQLVEQPAIQLFAEMEWETVSAADVSLRTALGNLRRTRDLLLPRLLSRQVALADAVVEAQNNSLEAVA